MDGKEQVIEEFEGLTDYNVEWNALEKNYSSQREAIEVDQLQEELEGKKQDRVQRKEYANKIFWLLCLYILVVMILLYLCAFSAAYMSEAVLIAVITTMTANVISIFIFVAKYLFHTKE